MIVKNTHIGLEIGNAFGQVQKEIVIILEGQNGRYFLKSKTQYNRIKEIDEDEFKKLTSNVENN